MGQPQTSQGGGENLLGVSGAKISLREMQDWPGFAREHPGPEFAMVQEDNAYMTLEIAGRSRNAVGCQIGWGRDGHQRRCCELPDPH